MGPIALTRQTELFETIRGKVNTRELALQLLRDLEQDLDTYLTLCSPEASDCSKTAKDFASVLKTFNVRQPFPLLLAAKRALSVADFDNLMRACVVISLRFNVICGYSPAEQERTYNSVAQHLAAGTLRTLDAVLPGLGNIYPNDSVFQDAFAEKSIRTVQLRNNCVVRYILCELELDGKASHIRLAHCPIELNPDVALSTSSMAACAAISCSQLGTTKR